MPEEFDVIVVGARCAGSPLAIDLVQRGLRVCVLDRARFPSEVPSTHLVQPSGVARLQRLGLGERLVATGAPPLEHGTFVIDDVAIAAGPAVTRLLGSALCVRRVTLDALLVEAAAAAGADVRIQTGVVGLIEEDGVVRGVRTEAGPLRASLVVGADGPHSSVARFVGAAEYHVTEPGRFFLWAYYEGAAGPVRRARLGKVGDIGFLAIPTDDGVFMAGVAPSMDARAAYMADVEGSFAGALAQLDEVPDVLHSATRVGPIRRMTNWHGYFRQATGPGWVLVGDAGHFKDPTPGQGISDALRQGEHLAAALEAGLGTGDLPRHLQDWWRWRDDDAWDMYWFARDMGAAGPSPKVAVEIFRDISRSPDGAERFMRVLDHDLRPSELFTRRRGLRAVARAALARPGLTPTLLSEVRSVVGDQRRRRRLRPEHGRVGEI